MRGRGGRAGSLLGWGREGFPDPRERAAAARASPRAHLRFFRNMPSGAPLPPFGWVGERLGSGPRRTAQPWANPAGRSRRLLASPVRGSLELPAPVGFCRTVGRDRQAYKYRECCGRHPGRCCSAALGRKTKQNQKKPSLKDQQIGFLCCLLTRVPDCVVDTDPASPDFQAFCCKQSTVLLEMPTPLKPFLTLVRNNNYKPRSGKIALFK